MAGSDAKPGADYTLVTREGGGQQWAYKGKPLYTFLGDQSPNERRGKGMNGVAGCDTVTTPSWGGTE